MGMKVQKFLLAVSMGAIITGCQDEARDKRGGGGDAGETGGEGNDTRWVPGCAPFDEQGEIEDGGDDAGGDGDGEAGDGDAEHGATRRHAYTCHGEGTGWLDVDLHGKGTILTCLRYADPNPPEEPTAADCAAVPLSEIPLGVPRPVACCDDGVQPESIADICAHDCGFAACKVAVAKIREHAEKLTAPNKFVEKAYKIAKSDLYHLANKLESPGALRKCANMVTDAGGKVIAFDLGRGSSSKLEFGHIKSSTLYIGCMLDEHEPFTLDEAVEHCEAATNIPTLLEEKSGRGPIVGGSVTVLSPAEHVVISISGGGYEHRTRHYHDLTAELHLTRFDGTIYEAAVDPFYLRDIHFELVEPAVGVIQGEFVLFAPEALHFRVTARGRVDGAPLFGGEPVTVEYVNTATATAILEPEGSFAFVDAPFRVGQRMATLVTAPIQ
jgi:hypothetical protein